MWQSPVFPTVLESSTRLAMKRDRAESSLVNKQHDRAKDAASASAAVVGRRYQKNIYIRLQESTNADCE